MKSNSGKAKQWIPLAAVALWACGASDDAADRRAVPRESASPAAAAQEAKPPAKAPDFSVAGLSVGEVEGFLASLKAAVANDDASAVAGMVRYPITVQLDGRSANIASASDFVSRYPDIVNGRVREAVLTQDVAELFVNWQGVMIGRGEVWFSAAYDDPRDDDAYELKIIAINNQE